MSDQEQIRLLLIEDDPNDAILLGRELQRAGIPYQAQRVENREDFVRELDAQLPDVILSDHGLPHFDGFSALAIAKEKCPDVPFLFVTGSLGEEMIIETLRRGATDYVLKHRLAKLVPAVQRAMREAEERRRRKAAEAERERLISELTEALTKVKTLTGLLPICSSCKNIRDDKGYWNRLEVYLQEHSEATLTHGICPQCAHRLYPDIFREPSDPVIA